MLMTIYRDLRLTARLRWRILWSAVRVFFGLKPLPRLIVFPKFTSSLGRTITVQEMMQAQIMSFPPDTPGFEVRYEPRDVEPIPEGYGINGPLGCCVPAKKIVADS